MGFIVGVGAVLGLAEGWAMAATEVLVSAPAFDLPLTGAVGTSEVGVVDDWVLAMDGMGSLASQTAAPIPPMARTLAAATTTRRDEPLGAVDGVPALMSCVCCQGTVVERTGGPAV